MIMQDFGVDHGPNIRHYEFRLKTQNAQPCQSGMNLILITGTIENTFLQKHFPHTITLGYLKFQCLAAGLFWGFLAPFRALWAQNGTPLSVN